MSEIIIDKENYDPIELFLSSSEDGVFYVGHSCIYVRLSGYKFLLDPVVDDPELLESWLFYPKQVFDKRFLDVDGVFISHFHHDHLDLNLLGKLDRNVPIYITKDRHRLSEMLKEFNLVVLPSFEKVTIFDKITILAMPSSYNKVDSSFILKNDNMSVYHGNDNFLYEEDVLKAHSLMGDVDVAFTPYAYIWWYPFCLESMSEELKAIETKRMVGKCLDLGLSHVQLLNAQIGVPFGGNLVYYDGANSVMNKAVLNPFDFKEYAESTDHKTTDRVHPLFAGDFIFKSVGVNEIYKQDRQASEFKKQLNAFVDISKEMSKKDVASRVSFNAADCKLLEDKVNKIDLVVDQKVFFGRNDLATSFLCVDLSKKTVYVTDKPVSDEKYSFFSIDPYAFEEWMGGKISFEIVLESARFSLRRNPEEFDEKLWEILRLCF